MTAARSPGCPLCEGPGGHLVIDLGPLRVIRVDEPGFPVFYRVVWTAHLAEFSDLAGDERRLCMDAVAAVESALRQNLRPEPDKINLAALGNMVAHLHWHVIARWRWDSHFPASTWGAAQRPVDAQRQAALVAALPALDQAVAQAVRSLA